MSIRVTWVVVADGERATIYAIPRGMARLRRVLDLEADRRRSDQGAPQVYGFAAELAHTLDEARREGRFDELVLVAAEAFLGQLRGSLGGPLRQALVGEIAKDLIGVGPERLQEEVLQVL